MYKDQVNKMKTKSRLENYIQQKLEGMNPRSYFLFLDDLKHLLTQDMLVHLSNNNNKKKTFDRSDSIIKKNRFCEK